jgi:hypothetical protein
MKLFELKLYLCEIQHYYLVITLNEASTESNLHLGTYIRDICDNNLKLLVIEDNAREQQRVVELFAGATEYMTIVDTYALAESLIPNHDLILSDLYFPLDAQGTNAVTYAGKQQFLSKCVAQIQDYQNRRCPPLNKDAECVRHAVGAW